MDVPDRIAQAESEVDYLDAVARELTVEVQRAVYKFAVRCCFGLRRQGVRVDADLAKNLAADAISDTATGERRWQVGRCTLVQHLRGVVRSQVSIMAAHHRRFPKVALAGDTDNGGGVTVPCPANDPDLSAMRELAAQVLSPLYEAANDNGDPQVALVLEAYTLGITKRAEVAEHTGMTAKEFDRARDRLNRMLLRLPEELRTAMAEVLGRR